MSDGPNSLTSGPGWFRGVRFRLLLIALMPPLVILPLLLWYTIASWSARFDEVLIAKVNGELTIAHQHLAGLMNDRSSAIAAFGASQALASRLTTGESNQELEMLLADYKTWEGLDFLYFLPAESAFEPSGSHSPANWPVIAKALEGGNAVAIDIFSPQDLSALDPDLVERAKLPLVPTPAAAPTDRDLETRGMVVHAAAPAPGGVVVGGVLLNRNLGFIDEINDLVYPAFSLAEGSLGTATLFLEDVRISTNVRMFDGVRALGTRVSAAVRERVLDEGKIWRDRAFVVNDWYVSAYEPVVDSFGTRIGMLYVGFLEAPFTAARWQTVRQIGLAFVALLAISVPLLLYWARGIFTPLEKMNTTIGKVETGDLGARTGPLERADEIGRVAVHLDTLLDQIQSRDRSLRDLNVELEDRVAARTRDLEEANRELKITSGQLIVAEKLAAIGEITAGVAHEINNPLAVIQGNLEVIQAGLGAQATAFSTELRLIFEQTHTINVMVSKLLQFARPEEFVDSQPGISVDEIIRESMPLIQHLKSRNDHKIVLNLSATGTVRINPSELQQVLINVVANAVQAMPNGGRVEIGSSNQKGDPEPCVEITVKDNGTGMDEATLASIFNPFFTTKPGSGTGLGLSISRKIVNRAGGTITAKSELGKGACFAIRLPLSHSII